jgi:iron complex outermembrane receptor protein
VRSLPLYLRLFALLAASLLIATAHAEPVVFNVPPQNADTAVLTFSRQSKTEVLFSAGELHKIRSAGVSGRYEPAEALKVLLTNTGFAARSTGSGKFIITPQAKPTGTLRGRLLRPDGRPAESVKVNLPGARQVTVTDDSGEFEFPSVPPGVYRIVASGTEYQTLEMTKAPVEPNHVQTLSPQMILLASDPSRLAPFVVESRVDRARFSDRDEMEMPPREATGNLDLIRTQNDALAYTIYDRDQISRSGVVSLNDFLQRELLDANSAARAPEQDARPDSKLFSTGSTNLSLRGYTSDETVVLVNGRRLPEVFVGGTDKVPPPDVNFIPLSLVQQVEVLPASASSLYTGNPVGGVINIVLRPAVDATATELTATYTNALRSYDAPQSSLSLLHAETRLGGKLRLRFNASVTQTTPPTESELRYNQRIPIGFLSPFSAVFRATPTVRSAEIQPLFGPGTAAFTSVAPGADGTGGIGAFAGRAGVRNLSFFNSSGDLAVSRDSVDFPYGRKQQRSAYFASIVYDLLPRVEIGLDVTYARTVATRGLDVFPIDLRLGGASPINPFRQDVLVSLNETAPLLGESYTESRVEFASAVLGVILKLPADWRLSIDTQYGHSVTKFRGLFGADPDRWQKLVDDGRYNPLRDTQVFAPPPAFYDEVLIYRGERGKFTTQGDYQTLDIAGRATNDSLPLPTGRGVFNLGGDYRRNHLDPYVDKKTYSDGTLYETPIDWTGRSIQRYSVFSELQAPFVPQKWLPRFIPKAEFDVAVRYIASDYTPEANIAPTYAAKVDLLGGFAVRGSFTTSNRFPSPQLTRIVLPPPTKPGVGVDPKTIVDPLRGFETYGTFDTEIPNMNLASEEAVTQTVGLIFKRSNKAHRLRASVDFVDTRKSNELVFLSEKTLVLLEKYFPGRVVREAPAPGDPYGVGRVINVFTGTINGTDRRSLNWNTSVDYAWAECFGGTLELYGRLLYFQRYKSRVAPGADLVDQLRRPDGTAPGLLKYRSNFGASWSRRDFGFGIDGHYFHSRVIPTIDWTAQGHDRIRPVWQFDPYIQGDLGRWLPWHDKRYGLRLQFRINNVFGAPFPKYVLESSGAGVQPYGDWRNRTYSLSLTATF